MNYSEFSLQTAKMSFLDTKTGESFPFGELTNLEQEPIYNCADENVPFFGEATINLDTSAITPEIFHSLVGDHIGRNKFSIEFDESKSVPARRHKRHRIQKKWIKRYGMKLAKGNRYRLDNVESVITDNNGTMSAELKSNCITMVKSR